MNSLVVYSRMIKLSHSIFALPFALAAAVLAARQVEVTLLDIGLIVGCMVAARSSAMGFNRIVDSDIDAKNPRTAGRELVTGAISIRAAWAFTLGSAAVFVLFAGLLGLHTLALAPIALAVVWGYSLSKRYSALCHIILGVALALAPSAVWIALTVDYGPIPALLSLAVGTWVAGFDIIYSCQDAGFDRDEGLYSIPSRFGVGPALVMSAGLHVITVGALVALPFVTVLAWPYWVGVCLIGAVLVYEHAIVSPSDLTRVNKAFFDLNGYISLVFLAVVLLA